jgi:NAD kinase
MLIQPVAAHTGLHNGLVLPDYSVIELKASDEHEAVLSVDGFTDTFLHSEDRVTIKRSPYVTRFLRTHALTTFYWRLL